MNRAAFFDKLRGTVVFSASIPASAVATCDAILDEAERRGSKITHLAYILATCRWECAEDMRPKRENLYFTTAARIRQVWPSRFPSDAAAAPFVKNPRALANQVYNGRMGNRMGSDDGYNLRGGGLPQLTGRENYERAERELGIPLLSNPDLMLGLQTAVAVTFQGMAEGWFTGFSLADAEAIPGYVDDRKIINGTDQAEKVAALAVVFEKALRAGGYAAAAPAPVVADAAAAWNAWLDQCPVPASPELVAWLSSMPRRVA